MENKQANECYWKFPNASHTRCMGSISTIMVPKCMRVFFFFSFPYCCSVELLRKGYNLSLSIGLKPENIAIHKVPPVNFYKLLKE